jgi:hypothetical protein
MSKGRAGKRLKSVNTILASLAGLAASAATILGVLFAHQNTQINQYVSIIQQKNDTIRALRAHHVAAPATPDPTASPGPSGGSLVYLSNVNPNVDSGDVSDGSTTMSDQSYPDSVTFSCAGLGANGQPTEAWDVAGHTTFSATTGIPDDTSDVTGYAAQFTFASQDGTKLSKTVSVSLGHPASVTFSISGVTQLDVTCNAVAPSGQQPFGFPVALGNASAS